VLVAELGHRADLCDRLRRPRNDGDVGVVHHASRVRLLAEPLHRLARRADPGDPVRRLDAGGEVGVLGEEPVSGVDRVGAGRLRGLDDRRPVEIRVGRAGRSHVVGLVRVSDVTRVFVRVAVHGDGVDTQLRTGAHHPNRYLPAVRDQNLVEHSCTFLPP